MKIKAFKADLSTYDGAKQLHKQARNVVARGGDSGLNSRTQVVEQMGHPDVLFNNAGAAIKTLDKAKGEGIGDVDAETFEKTWRVNCGTAFEVRARTPCSARVSPCRS